MCGIVATLVYSPNHSGVVDFTRNLDGSLNHRRDAHFKSHGWKSERFNAQLRPNRCMVRHVVPVQFHNGLIHDRREAANVIGIDVNNVRPICTCGLQYEVDIPECCCDFILDLLGNGQRIIPAAVARCFNSGANLDRAGKVQFLAEKIAGAGRNEEFRIIHL